jgi:ribonuclease T1
MGRTAGRNRHTGEHAAKTVIRQVLTGALMAWVLGVSPNLVHSRGLSPDASATLSGAQPGTIDSRQLPPQGQNMLTLIHQGGPFRHEKDGVVFGNRERILPANLRGYYREYTVRTPLERSRGARRIVCGGKQPAAPDACYYTDDHYASFRRIVE